MAAKRESKNVKYHHVHSQGKDPILLDSNLGLIDDVNEIAKKYSDRCITEKILPSSFWNKKRAVDCQDNELMPKSEKSSKSESK